jgi:hypothetical protein
MLIALSSIASAQAEPAKETMANVKIFLYYAATHQNAILTYHASNMVFIIHSTQLIVMPEDIFSCHQTQKTQATMELYSTLHSSSKQSCL